MQWNFELHLAFPSMQLCGRCRLEQKRLGFPFLLLSNFSTCSFAWLKPERLPRSLGMQPAGGSTSLFQSSLGARRRIGLRPETKSAPSSYMVSLLGSTMEENTCVLWGGVRRRGGLKLREILYSKIYKQPNGLIKLYSKVTLK